MRKAEGNTEKYPNFHRVVWEAAFVCTTFRRGRGSDHAGLAVKPETINSAGFAMRVGTSAFTVDGSGARKICRQAGG